MDSRRPCRSSPWPDLAAHAGQLARFFERGRLLRVQGARLSVRLARSPGAVQAGYMADRQLPPSLRRRSDLEAIVGDIEPYRGTTVEERSRILSALCRAAVEQILQHPTPERILAWQDRRSPASQHLWADMVHKARDR